MDFSILTYLIPVWILASLAGAVKKFYDREENSFIVFVKFLGEFLFYPVIKALEEYNIKLWD